MAVHFSRNVPRQLKPLCVALTTLIFLTIIIILSSSKTDNYSPKFEYRGVVESADGIGFEFHKKNFEVSPRFQDFENLPPCYLQVQQIENPRNNILDLIRGFHDCIDPIFQSLKENATKFSLEFAFAAAKCDEIAEFRNLSLDATFENQHEVKWAIMPSCKENHTMITLGVGHDTDAEEKLNLTLPNTQFYGADPIIEPNIQLYSSFGKFFPFAIGRQTGISQFIVLPNQNQQTRNYMKQDVTTLEVNFFLKEVLKVSQIDFFWIDIEGGEIEFLDYFHKNQAFDQNNLQICQFNIELHPDLWNSPGQNGYEKVLMFIENILEENRYIFLKPAYTMQGVYRLFFINVENPKCVRKYLY